MELERKEFYFDLDVDSLKRTYSDHDSSSWNAAWSDIRELLEKHGFEKSQYSGYESADKMSYLEAYHVVDILSDKLPWFRKNIEIDAPELEEEVSLAGESHDMASASEHQPESEMPENVLSTVL